MDASDVNRTNKEMQTVRDFIASFGIAMKNYALYPEKHIICQKSISAAKTRLDDFFETHNCLRLDVVKDQLLFGEEIVFQHTPNQENLPFYLFRDGIQWLEFQKSITVKEISGFIKILNKYKDSQEEAEGDLVTALWENNFPNLLYKAANVLWDDEPLQDLSLLNAGKPQSRGENQQVDGQDISAENNNISQISLHSSGDYLWKLSHEEGMELQHMIIEAENGDSAQDILDVLLVVINDQLEKKDLEAILGFLANDFKDTLLQGDFEFAHKLLRGLNEKLQLYRIDKPWAIQVLKHFFMELSAPQVLGLLSQVWPTLDSLDTARIKSLRQFLLLLPSEAILALGPMLPQIRSSNIQRQLMEVIGIMAKRDLRPLEQLLDSSEEFVVQKLVYILGHLNGEKPTQILLKMVHHPSDRVRKTAIKHLLDRDEQTLEKVFHLIDDPDTGLQRLLLDHLGSRRNKLGENLLLGYLGNGHFKPSNGQHLLDCYKALGRCGSADSILLLRERLLNKRWIPGTLRSLHRQGAVMALTAMETADAEELLIKASRSLFPSVRLAYRKGVEAGQ